MSAQPAQGPSPLGDNVSPSPPTVTTRSAAELRHLTQLDKGYVAAVWIETFGYGVYFALYCLCVYTLLLRRTRLGKGHVLPLAVTLSITAMLVLGTIHVAIGLTRLVRGFGEFSAGTGIPGTLAMFMGEDNWLNILKEVTYTLNVSQLRVKNV